MFMQIPEIDFVPVPDRGPWLATSTGGCWSILDPHPQDVHADDIANGLSRACRYAGQIREDLEFYSVSEHSVLMTEHAVETGIVTYLEDALAILLHDGSEAFYGDMTSPLKAIMPEFKRIEDRAQAAIYQGFGLSADRIGISKAQIKALDLAIRLDERSALILDPAKSMAMAESWKMRPDSKPLGVQILALLPSKARIAFLGAFVEFGLALPRRVPENPRLDLQLDRAATTLTRLIDAIHMPEPSLDL